MIPNHQSDEAILIALREAAMSRPNVDERTPGCLPEEILAGMAEGLSERNGLAAHTEHISSCRRCQRDLASLVRALNDPGVRFAAKAGTPLKFRVAAVLVPMAAAAAVVFAVIRPDERGGLPTGGQHRAPVLAPGAEPVGLSPVGAVGRVSDLHWSTVPNADSYRVTLFDADGRVLLEAEASDTTLTLPDSIRLAPSERYLWQVQARIGYNRWASSNLIEFRLFSPPP